MRPRLKKAAVTVGVILTALAVVLFGTPSPATHAAEAAQSAAIQQLINSGAVIDGTDSSNVKDQFPGLPEDTYVVIVPGTDDGSLLDRTAGLRGPRPVLIVQYPESVWPIISGKSGKLLPIFAPTYDQSKDKAVANTLEVFRALKGQSPSQVVVYNGYSQGSDALLNAVEKAMAQGLLNGNEIIIADSDPRSPWGAKQWIDTTPLSLVMPLVGAKSDGARNPADTGDVVVFSRIATGDPVSNWQWVWYRPVSSVAVNVAGFLTMHSGRGPQHFGNIDEWCAPEYLHSTDGNTTYVVCESAHPFSLFSATVLDAVGIKTSQKDLDKMDKINNLIYPIQKPTQGNAAVSVEQGLRPWPTPDAASSDATDNQSVQSQQDSTPVESVPSPAPAQPEAEAVAATEPEVAPVTEGDPVQAPAVEEAPVVETPSDEAPASESELVVQSEEASPSEPQPAA